MSTRVLFITLAVLLALTGCTSSPPANEPTAPSPESGATAPEASATESTEPGEPSPQSGASSTPTVPAEPAETVAQPPPPTGSAPDAPRGTPGVPDPTTAGPLDQSSLPNPVLGFNSVVGEAREGEYNPNGTWVHAVDPVAQSREALPLCATAETAPPSATHALAATYADAQQRPGNGLALEFASASDAAAWWQAYTDQLRACGPGAPLTVTDLAAEADRFVARRAYPTGETWSETGRLSGTRVLLVLIAGGEHSLPALRATLG